MCYSSWGHKESDTTEHRIAPKNETIETVITGDWGAKMAEE